MNWPEQLTVFGCAYLDGLYLVEAVSTLSPAEPNSWHIIWLSGGTRDNEMSIRYGHIYKALELYEQSKPANLNAAQFLEKTLGATCVPVRMPAEKPPYSYFRYAVRVTLNEVAARIEKDLRRLGA